MTIPLELKMCRILFFIYTNLGNRIYTIFLLQLILSLLYTTFVA